MPKFYVRSLPVETGKDFDREKERLKLEDDTRKTVAQIVGGAVILGSLLFTYNTFRLQQEGQITDRFTKAVAQLGDDKLEVRLGGLYALERIAKDSPKDHWTVMEILSAFIRENSKKLEVSEQKNSIESANENTNKPKQNIEITTDIQAALTIIGRRKIEQDSHNDEIDLRGANLPEVDLSGANLSKADLGVTYEGTEFFRLVHSTNLKAANLIRTNLEFANLPLVDLQFADLRSANLRSANLSLAKLKCTKFWDADLYKTNIQGADLSCADLRMAKNITFEQLLSAKIDENTILPEYLEERKSELLESSKKVEESQKGINKTNEK